MRPKVSTVVVVYDRAVEGKFLQQAVNGFANCGLKINAVKISGGDKNKTADRAIALANKLVRLQVDRNSLVVAIGGGVCSDLTGFSASLALRGIRWACLPTTLLSMVDAGLGGKTGVNTAQGKNLLGAFHFPEFMHVDFRWLKTLPTAEFASGLGELQKTALLAGGKLLSHCQRMTPRQYRGPSMPLRAAIEMAVKYKSKVVNSDPKEGNLRRNLNFGHTFGHAIESAMSPSITHGEAVSYGISCAITAGIQLGVCSPQLQELNQDLVERMGLAAAQELKLPSRSEINRHLRHDKKAIAGKLSLVLLEKAGRPRVMDGFSASEISKIIFANRRA
ncbi:MAG: 3-dehydroquinate synthase family protein [Planctomycetota bacterium]|nr:3-dehydroquinate synthase family protein [Planctomycetota bacterium]